MGARISEWVFFQPSEPFGFNTAFTLLVTLYEYCCLYVRNLIFAATENMCRITSILTTYRLPIPPPHYSTALAID